MADVDRSKLTVEEVAWWVLKKEEMGAIATDIAEQATNAVEKSRLKN